ncbi:MAG: ribulokinase [Firmicutes bacterium]|nr:ribulokinase [Bacillota bacterium]
MAYLLGLDYGTLSARGILLDIGTGKIAGEEVFEYPHGVIEDSRAFSRAATQAPGEGDQSAALEEELRLQAPSEGDQSAALEEELRLQAPEDYLQALQIIPRRLMEHTGIPKEEILAVGVDVTASTLLPVDQNWQPLSFDSAFRNRPHAWCKLWKSHSAQDEADHITGVLNENSDLLDYYGGKVSSEWTVPKMLETLRKDPEIYRTADAFIEAGDWICYLLGGVKAVSACGAGYKAFWMKPDEARIQKGLQDPSGYPSKKLLTAIDPAFEDLLQTKLSYPVLPLGTVCGHVGPSAARLTGLMEGTAVCPYIVDAHAALPGSGLSGVGELLLILGTSACSVICSDKYLPVQGICGSVYGGILTGLYGYEAGQPSVGDMFAWFAGSLCGKTLEEEAKRLGESIHTVLCRKAERIKPGQSGLMALDWWSGNRSILDDSNLRGCIFGLSQQTKPEEIYRALLEAAAYGLRTIAENYERFGIEIKSITASGTVATKNPLFMQILSDVMNRDITVSGQPQPSAMGAALQGARALGLTVKKAEEQRIVYHPDEQASEIYARLYRLYHELYELMGRREAGILHELGAISKETGRLS